jgi:hypothetical protein
MRKHTLDITGSQNAEKNFYSCLRGNNCMELKDGKMFTCNVICNANRFNSYFKQNIPITEKDYIDIFKAKTIDEILDFISLAPPFCAYCNLKAKKTGLQWEVSKREIGEWT